MSPNAKVRFAKRVSCRKAADGLVVFDAAGVFRYRANRTASSILSGCKDGLSLLRMAERLSREHAVPLGRAYHDVTKLIMRCMRLGLIEEMP